VVTLVHTLINNKDLTKVNRVLILMPINVQLNWQNEFTKWTSKCQNKLNVYQLPASSSLIKNDHLAIARLRELEKWFDEGGVFLMGYSIFSQLVRELFFSLLLKLLVFILLCFFYS
jgi:hypothetical protein